MIFEEENNKISSKGMDTESPPASNEEVNQVLFYFHYSKHDAKLRYKLALME